VIAAIVFIPLMAAFYTGILSRVISNKKAQFVTCGGLVISALLSAVMFYKVAVLGQPETMSLFRWIDSGSFQANWVLKVDSLTAVMLVVVTWVSALVHIYSVGYMSHDHHVPRFMSYLSLFTFFMLVLVTSDNFLQMFVGWEGVGVCSYLLIGFWFNKPSANAAAMKAFIVNRVGDFGFILGIFAIYKVFGTLQFDEVFTMAHDLSGNVLEIFAVQYNAITVICLLLFIGAMGKSAQLGLHTWLPDAMEGPTPVSALIHAATMVTAGVFMVARCSPLFEYSIVAREVVTVVGAVTCIFAASVAITQNDIKRVIAYSTCSQLGYMFFACGVSAYSAGVFHLMTHGFFKALLFLGAGSVIHALSNEQDLRKMGGVWKKIPITYALMWIGSLALAGVFPFAGYYSKDIILESAYASGGMGHFAYWVGIAAAFLTALYSWRLIILAFHGKPRASAEVMSHVHESPAVMLIPLFVLSAGAIFSGIVGANVLGMVEVSGDFWNGAIAVILGENPLEAAHHIPSIYKLMPSIVGAAGIALAYILYLYMPSIPGKIASAFSPIYKFLLNKWYFDELYEFLFVKPSKALGQLLWKTGDVKLVDGLGPNGAAWLSQKLASGVSRLQTGLVYNYALVMLLGLFFIVSWFVFKIIFGV
jgi:NADH-quinone oxidoreductase subunit L